MVVSEETTDPLVDLSEHRRQEYRSIQSAIGDELNANPSDDISPVKICGAAGAEPAVWIEPIDTALDSEHPVESVPIPTEID